VKIAHTWYWFAFLPMIFCFPLAEGTARAESAPETALVVLPKNAAPPLEFGAGVLRGALNQKGLQAKVETQRSSADFEVVVSEKGAAVASSEGRQKLPTSPSLTPFHSPRTSGLPLWTEVTPSALCTVSSNWRSKSALPREATGRQRSSRSASRPTLKCAASICS
jgi:hypothetical protein